MHPIPLALSEWVGWALDVSWEEKCLMVQYTVPPSSHAEHTPETLSPFYGVFISLHGTCYYFMHQVTFYWEETKEK